MNALCASSVLPARGSVATVATDLRLQRAKGCQAGLMQGNQNGANLVWIQGYQSSGVTSRQFTLVQMMYPSTVRSSPRLLYTSTPHANVSLCVAVFSLTIKQNPRQHTPPIIRAKARNIRKTCLPISVSVASSPCSIHQRLKSTEHLASLLVSRNSCASKEAPGRSNSTHHSQRYSSSLTHRLIADSPLWLSMLADVTVTFATHPNPHESLNLSHQKRYIIGWSERYLKSIN